MRTEEIYARVVMQFKGLVENSLNNSARKNRGWAMQAVPEARVIIDEVCASSREPILREMIASTESEAGLTISMQKKLIQRLSHRLVQEDRLFPAIPISIKLLYGASLILVCLGVHSFSMRPSEEKFMENLSSNLSSGLLVGVSAALFLVCTLKMNTLMVAAEAIAYAKLNIGRNVAGAAEVPPPRETLGPRGMR